MNPTQYRCMLLGYVGRVLGIAVLTADNDSDAVIQGGTLENQNPACVGLEIRTGSRLVYLRSEGRVFKSA